MTTTEEFKINAYHWALAIGLAVIVHSLILLNYHQTNKTLIADDNVTNEIVLSLKKLRMPQPVEPNIPQVTQPIVQPPKPLAKKTIPVKPKVTKKPVKKVIKKPVKKLMSKPVETVKSQPIVEPMLKDVPKVQTKVPTRTAQVIASTNAISNKIIEEERLRYQIKLSAWLAKHKKYPSIARRRGLEGSIKVSFAIDKRGNLLRHSIVEPCPHDSLNKAVVKMLKRASPMPAVPQSIAADQNEFEYTLPINYQLSGK